MGLLGDFLSAVDSRKRIAADRLGQSATDPVGLLNRAMADVEQQYRPLVNAAVQGDTAGVINSGLLGPLQTVWHGSPHLFDKFDASKIGTGEGAQAYGHGLYFAENPDVAKDYAYRLAKSKEGDLGYWEGKTFPDALSLDEMMIRGKLGLKMREKGNLPPAEMAKWQELTDRWNARQESIDAVRPKPNMYKVDLPDEMIPKMLDWDKPLSQQPAALGVLRKAGIVKGNTVEGLEMARGKTAAVTPEQLVDDLSTQWGNDYGMPDLLAIDARNGREAAAKYLRSLGIPGIRYLDAGSRGAKQGTYNYVVFPGNEGLLKILERQ